MNILITGIHGFVGSNIVASIKNQHTIYGLDIVSPQKDGVVKTFGWKELSDIPPVDCIIHLAGKAHDTKNQTNAQVYFDINTGLTQKIFDWFLTTNASKFIFFSSVKAAADQVEGDILTEEVVPAPKGPYGESKIAAERYLRERMQEYTSGREGDKEIGREGDGAMGREAEDATRNPSMPESVVPECEANRSKAVESSDLGTWNLKLGTWNLKHGTWNLKPETWNLKPGTSDKKVFILRPCMIHGPGNKGNLNLLYKLVKKGLPWPLGAFENKRSFTSIDNLTYLINQLIEKDIEPGIYQVADDETLSTNEIIRLIAASQSRKPSILNISKKMISLLAKTGDIFHLPLNTERLKKLTESYIVSNQKIKKALGIEKMPFTSKEGFKKTFGSFKG